MDQRRQELSKRLSDEGLVASSVCFEKILSENINVDELVAEARREEAWLITDDFLQRFIKREEELTCAAQELVDPGHPCVMVERTRQVYAKEIESQLVIDAESDVSGRSTCDGDLEDFIQHFNGRFRDLGRIIRDRLDYRTPTSIESLRRGREGREKLRIVCMVANKRESGKGHRFFDVEDPTGQITVLLPQTDQRMKSAYERTLLDEVVGIEGRLSNDIFIADDVVQPDIPTTNQPHYAEEPVHMALLSDLHVGSYLFLEREFGRFIDWLHGKGNGVDVAERVKYILIAGDLVDGIGIYPNQEKELVIPDVYKQYEFLGALLSKIPDYIEVVVAMGNHDAVRNAEPQPKLSEDIGASLYALENVHVTGNPVHVTAHGVRTLMYHGTTLDTMIANLGGCTYAAPENAMIEYLKRRHLAPIYGRDPLAPEETDYMAIRTLPDILHCGHVHTNGYGHYKGVRVVNSGTFQAKTRYQEQLGHMPTPARVPILNLQNFEVTVMDFGG